MIVSSCRKNLFEELSNQSSFRSVDNLTIIACVAKVQIFKKKTKSKS